MNVCGKHVFDVMLDVAHTNVIRNRFLLKDLVDKECHENVVEIPTEKENKYLERLSKDITEGFIQNVFSNRNLKCPSFRSELRSQITKDLVVSLPSDIVFTLIMSMMDCGFCDIDPILLVKDINFNQLYWDGETPLFKAVCKGYTEIVRILLKQNADPNYCSCLNGFTVESICYNDETHYRYSNPTSHGFQTEDKTSSQKQRFSAPQLTSIPDRKKQIETCVARQCQQDNIRKRGPRFQQLKTHKISPLHIAVRNGDIEVVKLLLFHNAKPDFVDNSQSSPFGIALNRGFIEIAKVLLENKPDLKIQTSERVSQSCLKKALRVAIEKGYHDIERLLLNHTDDLMIWYPEAIVHIPDNRIFIRNLKSYC